MNIEMTHNTLTIAKRGSDLILRLKSKSSDTIDFTTNTKDIASIKTKQSFLDDRVLFDVADKQGHQVQFEVESAQAAQALSADVREAIRLFATARWSRRDSKVMVAGFFAGVIGLIIVAQSLTASTIKAQASANSLESATPASPTAQQRPALRSGNADAWTPQ